MPGDRHTLLFKFPVVSMPMTCFIEVLLDKAGPPLAICCLIFTIAHARPVALIKFGTMEDHRHAAGRRLYQVFRSDLQGINSHYRCFPA